MQDRDPLPINRLHKVRQVAVSAWSCQHQSSARQQRGIEFPDGGIKTERGLLQNGIVRARGKPRLHPQHVVGQRPVRDQNAFRAAGGAGGVDHVGEIPAVHGSCRIRRFDVGLCGRLGPFVQNLDPYSRRCGHLSCQPGVRQDERRLRIVHHEGQTIGRIVRIDGDIGAARLEDGQQTDHHFDGPLHTEGHTYIRTHTERLQMGGHPVGPRVQLAVGKCGVFKHQCHRIGRPFHLLFKQAMNTG